MTDRLAAAGLVATSRASQGLPPTVQDPLVLARIAALLTNKAAVPTEDRTAATPMEGTRHARRTAS